MDMFGYVNTNYIMSLSNQIQEYKKIEENKLDFKRHWYKFYVNNKLNKPEVIEFCKDVAAIANTVGDKGLIVIGLDESTGAIFHSPLKNSGITEMTLLRGFVSRHVDLPPTFILKEVSVHKKIVTVICIPPSLEKPHVIKLWRGRPNFIPVRKNTSTCPASRSDIEYMYFDRKNIEPEYQLLIEILGKERIGFFAKEIGGQFHIQIVLDLLIQNTGRRPIAIRRTELLLDSKVKALSKIAGLKYSMVDHKGQVFDIPLQRPLIVESNSAINAQIDFLSDPIIEKDIPEILERLDKMRAFRAIVKMETNGGYMFKSNKV